MLELNAINNQATYVDEDLVYLDNLMIRLDCAADIYNRFGKNIECSEEDFKQFTQTAVQWVKITIDKIIAALKYIVELLKKGIPKALSKLNTYCKSKTASIELKSKATIMCMWSDALNGRQRDNNKLTFSDFKRNNELEALTSTYISKWKNWKSITPKIIPNVSHEFHSAISYCENLIANATHIKSHIVKHMSNNESKLDSNKRRNAFIKLLSTYGFNALLDTEDLLNQKRKIEEVFSNLLKAIHKKQHAYAIWFKYARQTLDLEQSIAMGEKSKGFLYFYDIPQAVRFYLANYFKEFYDTKGHATLKVSRMCVYSNTKNASDGGISSRGLVHGLSIDLNTLIRHDFEDAAFAILHELAHSSQDIHKTQNEKSKLLENTIQEERDKTHDERFKEIHADKIATYFITRVKKGKIPEDNPFYAWLHKVISAIKRQMKTIHYTLPNTTSIKLDDIDNRVNLDKRVSRFKDDDI